MVNNSRVLAIIPARSGSKRLPGKNKKKLAGKPLIQWTIEAALECDLVTEVVVSTDDASIIELAKKIGASAPFVRPDYLSGDSSASIDVVIHTIEYYKSKGHEFDYVMLLQPTSPLRNSQDIRNAINLKFQKKASAIVSVCETEHSPLWCNTLDDSMDMASFLKNDVKKKRSQDLPKYYRLNGALYLADTDLLLSQKTMFIKDNIFAYIMDRKSSVDIDEHIDFLLAESILINEK